MHCRSAVSRMIFYALATLTMAAHGAAQQDLCWREPHPYIPGAWAAYGYVIEAGDRFRTIAGATIQLVRMSDDSADATDHPTDSTPVREAVSNARGLFTFGSRLADKMNIPSGLFEMRATAPGREPAYAYIRNRGQDDVPQWVGRGLRIALAQEGSGCSRIYNAAPSDVDCGPQDCDSLPAGRLKVEYSDGHPVANAKLLFHRSGKAEKDTSIESTDDNGIVQTATLRGCYTIDLDAPANPAATASTQQSRGLYLCFRTVKEEGQQPVRVVLPPQPNPFDSR